MPPTGATSAAWYSRWPMTRRNWLRKSTTGCRRSSTSASRTAGAVRADSDGAAAAMTSNGAWSEPDARNATFAAGFALGIALAGLCAAEVAQAKLLPSAKARAPKPEPPRAANLPIGRRACSGRERVSARSASMRAPCSITKPPTKTRRCRASAIACTSPRASRPSKTSCCSRAAIRTSPDCSKNRRASCATRATCAMRRCVPWHSTTAWSTSRSRRRTSGPSIPASRSAARAAQNTSGVELEELNFLGTGTQLGIGFKSDVDRDSKLIHYRDRQLGSSWWDLDDRLLRQQRRPPGASSRSTIRSTALAAAGPRACRCSTTSARTHATTWARWSTSSRRTRSYSTIYWGRSGGLKDGWARRLSVGLTYEDHTFGAVPGASAAPALLPSDRTLVYPWIGAEWVEDAFYTARNRDQIEKTEDYSLGWRARAQLGYATRVAGFRPERRDAGGHGVEGAGAVRAAIAVLRRRHARTRREWRDRRRPAHRRRALLLPPVTAPVAVPESVGHRRFQSRRRPAESC